MLKIPSLLDLKFYSKVESTDLFWLFHFKTEMAKGLSAALRPENIPQWESSNICAHPTARFVFFRIEITSICELNIRPR